MRKCFVIVALTSVMVGRTALPAFAGKLVVNTAPTVSLEAMGTARNVTISTPVGDAVTFSPSVNVQVANTFFVTLTNATFIAGTVYLICDGLVQLAATAPGSVPSFGTTAIQPVNMGTKLHVTSEPSCLDTGQDLSISLNSASSATSATIRFRVLSVGGTELDAAVATLATIAPEYSATFTVSSHVIDVVNALGEQFTGPIANGTGVSASGADAAPRVLADSARGTGATNVSIKLMIAPNAFDDNFYGLGAAAVIRVIDGNNFQGVSEVFIADRGTDCNSQAAVGTPAKRGVATISGQTATIDVPPGSFSAATAPGSVDFTLCVRVAGGSTFLEPRTLNASADFNVTGPAGCCKDLGVTSALPVQIWNTNGADIRVTGVRGNATNGINTVISINNLGSKDASIRRLEVYRILATATATAPACTVSPVGTKTIFAQSGNLLLGTDINALCVAQAPFLPNEAYGARLVLDMAPGNVGVNAVRLNQDGTQLPLHVLKGSTGGATFATE